MGDLQATLRRQGYFQVYLPALSTLSLFTYCLQQILKVTFYSTVLETPAFCYFHLYWQQPLAPDDT